MHSSFFITFLLNAFILSLISTVTTEARLLFDLPTDQLLKTDNYNFDPEKPEKKNTSIISKLKNFRLWKFLGVLGISFIVSLIIYIIVFYITGDEITFIYLFGNLDSTYPLNKN